MNQAAVTAWIATLKAGDAVAVYDGSRPLFETKVVRRTTTGMVVCEPGGTFKPSGYPHGRLADQSRRLRPVKTQPAEPDYQGWNPDGFGFVDVCGEEWKGYINFFWKSQCLALLPPPIATEIRAAIISARKNGDRTGTQGVGCHMDLLPKPAQSKPAAQAAPRQHVLTPGKTLFVANKGTPDELTIEMKVDGTFRIDNVFGDRGKRWLEFPRIGKNVAACKGIATRIFGEAQEWAAAE
ncbi:hypothetical protein NPS53_09460 [Pseudomonas putida]|uniref:hypothetical protein n=1 Tax=Pseudomonas putida TaxID=303 RepID=UPI002363F0F3|nr:hypothetical protein [Pseudomonas putida]MDD2139804.1 hypothetical protein [Pseudomonas putida]HDS1721728.1 hypothetical protein [Pseudomonas putida]